MSHSVLPLRYLTSMVIQNETLASTTKIITAQMYQGTKVVNIKCFEEQTSSLMTEACR